ncbi:thiamine-phosphate pyrophosphorylase [Rhodoblastus acidophilus]|uniref:thiamine phosphate synthase n=1 Tax=Rhodoblastus acidophilus TaxID=1074 RepID=UPI002224A38D|nr:thiamine phosphate synthase [Rhodoblastus acidophilus]MCW2282355.1 thiamine-phosphate pyrophosphorylase [Rhodoblastus acidophilus]MCW2331240.1 thiamine-phosphate pyrophosphorylase [Rhodoblastus acidophilus]
MTDFIRPRLYLISPLLASAEDFAPKLEKALASGDVACVLLRFGTADEGARKKIAKLLAPIIQQAEAAALALDDAQLVGRAGLDGAHITGAGENFEDALERLKPDRIVGAGELDTRDAAMGAGETDVDYLLFGALDAQDNDAAVTLEWTSWWAEVFNVPCVGVAHAPEEVEALAKSGAEFLGLGESFFDAPETIAAAQAVIDAMEPTA